MSTTPQRLPLFVCMATAVTLGLTACSAPVPNLPGVAASTPPPRTVADLKQQLLPVPSGYTVSTEPSDENGVLTPAEYDKDFGGNARAEGFRAGYQETYYSGTTDDSLAVALLRFDSIAAANQWLITAEPANAIAQQQPRAGSVRDLPRARTFDATLSNTDGLYDHLALAAKGTVVAGMIYENEAGGGTPPAELIQWLHAQYQLIQAK